jgi:hypothetical protein
VVEVTYTCGDPDLAYRMANTLRDVYIRRTVRRLGKILQEAETYFLQRKQKTEAELVALTEQILQFKMKYPGVDPENPLSIDQAVTSLERRRETLLERRRGVASELTARRAFLEGRQAAAVAGGEENRPAGTSTLVPNPRREEILREIARREREVNQLQLVRRMTDQHPEVRYRLQAIRQLATALKDEPELISPEERVVSGLLAPVSADDGPGADVARQAWEAQVARVEMEIDTLEESEERIANELAKVDEQVAAYAEMRDSLLDRRQEYVTLVGNREQAEAQLAQLNRNLEVITRSLEAKEHREAMGFSTLVPATKSRAPVSPRFATIMVLSLMLGLGLGAAAVVFSELLDRKFRTTSQIVRALGLPVLESVSEIVTPAERRRRLVLGVVVSPLVVLALMLIVAGTGAWAYGSIENPSLMERWRSKLRVTLVEAPPSAGVTLGA